MTNPPDLDHINNLLADYWRWLFKSGKPYYHYSETINSVAACRPLLRRSLQQAWDLAFMWGSFEPMEHHTAMPYQSFSGDVVSDAHLGMAERNCLRSTFLGRFVEDG